MAFSVDTKEHREASKTALQDKVAALQTKDGADAFVAQRRQRLSAYLPKLGDAMKARAMVIKDKLDNRPDEVVAEEIQKAQKRLAELDKQSEESIEWQRQ